MLLFLLGSAAVLYAAYEVATGKSLFSWRWVIIQLPAVYGCYLLGLYAMTGRLTLASQGRGEA